MTAFDLRGLLGKLVLVLAGFALTLGGLELGARVAGFEPAPPATIPIFAWEKKGELWLLPPYRRSITAAAPDGKRYPIRANGLGLRGPDVGLKPAGTTRVVFLGDSVTYGHAVDERTMFVHRLNESPIEGAGTVEVVGAAMPGWSARQQRLFLEGYGRALDVDVVVVGVVLNDLTELLRGVRHSATEQAIASINLLTYLAERSAAMALLKRAYVWLFDPVAREIASVRELAEKPNSRAVRHAVELHLAELQHIRAFAGELGASFGVVVFPFRFQLESPELNAPQQAMLRYGEEQGVPTLDLLPVLSVHPANEVMHDRSHLSREGHAIAAAAIGRWLGESGLLDDQSASAGSR